MKFEFCAGGSSLPVIRDFKVETTTEIVEGQAITLIEGYAYPEDGQGILLGVSAETHSGKEDILNPRANGERLRVNISPDAVYSVKASQYKISEIGNPMIMKYATDRFDSSVKTGAFVLVSKTEGSTNIDDIGKVRELIDVSVSEGTATVTVGHGGNACVGDVYAYYPDIGDIVALDKTMSTLGPVNTDTDMKLKVVDVNMESGKIYLKLENPLFA